MSGGPNVRVHRLACPAEPGMGVFRNSRAAPGARGMAGAVSLGWPLFTGLPAPLSRRFLSASSTDRSAAGAGLPAEGDPGTAGTACTSPAGTVSAPAASTRGCGETGVREAYQAAAKAARRRADVPAEIETGSSAHSRQTAVVPEMKMPQPSSSVLRCGPDTRFSARRPRRLTPGSARWRPTAHTALPCPTQPLQSM